jgi:hypothetical protein
MGLGNGRRLDRNQSRGEPEQKQPQDTQRYVRRLVGYLGQPSRELYLEGIFTAKTGGVEDLLLPGYCCSLEVLGKEFQGPAPGRLCRLLMVPGAGEAAVRLRRNCHGQPMEDTDGTTHVIHFPGWFTHPDESQ